MNLVFIIVIPNCHSTPARSPRTLKLETLNSRWSLSPGDKILLLRCPGLEEFLRWTFVAAECRPGRGRARTTPGTEQNANENGLQQRFSKKRAKQIASLLKPLQWFLAGWETSLVSVGMHAERQRAKNLQLGSQHGPTVLLSTFWRDRKVHW